jgi:hypothetical protein
MHCLGLLFLHLMVWYNKDMPTFNEYPAQKTFVAEQPLDGNDFKGAIEYRIVNAVPSNDEGEVGDVVYVMESIA